MSERWIARVSLFAAISMIVGLFGVWTAAGKPTESPLVTVGAALGRISGGTALYGIQVRNQGAGDARDVRVFGYLPEGLRAKRALPAGDCGAERCTWRIGDLAVGEVRAILLTVAVDDTTARRARLRAVATSDNSPTSTHMSRALQVSRSGAVTAAAQAATCIDVDPETGTAPANGEIQYTALVTDGAKVSNDVCDGAPVAGTQLAWVIEEDDPDSWISSQDGVPTTKTDSAGDAQPDEVTTSTNAAGLTFTRIRVDDPATLGTGRYSAHFGADIAEPGSHPLCDIPVIGPPCPGEDDNEDDVTFTWLAATAGPTATPTGTPTRAPTIPPSSPSPTTPQKTERQVTLEPSRSVAKAGKRVTFAGHVASTNHACAATQFVRLQRRVFGEQFFSEFASATTDSSGDFAVSGQVDFNAEYVAVLGETDACAEVLSSPERVNVKAAVSASPNPARPRRGARFTITGSVSPHKEGTDVLLQRVKRGRFRTIERDTLGAVSEYRFRLRANFKKRVFRVLWKAQDDLNEAGSRQMRVRTRR